MRRGIPRLTPPAQDVVGMLLAARARPDDGEEGAMSPLRAACELGRQDLVELLLDADADPQRRAQGVPARAKSYRQLT